eukprot:TRINITY_DN10500_c0_g2_i2.p2 TRINITY_DN10500_c0_g2~~TRINITY_DN10500_c0_g2_i2.p2  ORF type:complete len:170 (-),score=3.66 TRINITY_DN10500_c0_g2_i2:18-527(-)
MIPFFSKFFVRQFLFQLFQNKQLAHFYFVKNIQLRKQYTNFNFFYSLILLVKRFSQCQIKIQFEGPSGLGAKHDFFKTKLEASEASPDGWVWQGAILKDLKYHPFGSMFCYRGTKRQMKEALRASCLRLFFFLNASRQLFYKQIGRLQFHTYIIQIGCGIQLKLNLEIV